MVALHLCYVVAAQQRHGPQLRHAQVCADVGVGQKAPGKTAPGASRVLCHNLRLLGPEQAGEEPVGVPGLGLHQQLLQQSALSADQAERHAHTSFRQRVLGHERPHVRQLVQHAKVLQSPALSEARRRHQHPVGPTRLISRLTGRGSAVDVSLFGLPLFVCCCKLAGHHVPQRLEAQTQHD